MRLCYFAPSGLGLCSTPITISVSVYEIVLFCPPKLAREKRDWLRFQSQSMRLCYFAPPEGEGGWELSFISVSVYEIVLFCRTPPDLVIAEARWYFEFQSQSMRLCYFACHILHPGL